ncbi:hypothetical protein [Candidatus Methylocalor cossyra]|uniref:Uncharacterized lipoprotein YajG n=1 Tax=Candidatus Methylocalor cossyra TaxID=3108543 RepID=A0ABM9NM55_9GAMM
MAAFHRAGPNEARRSPAPIGCSGGRGPRIAAGWGGVLGLALAAGGCTFLNTGPERIPVAVQGPEGVSSEPVGEGRRVVVQLPFADQRPDPDHCGVQKITYGLTPGLILCTGLPADDLGRQLVNSLRAAGYAARAADGTRPKDALLIEGQLLKLYIEPVQGVANTEADLHVRLLARSADGLEAEREFYLKGRAGDYQRALNSAVRKTLTAMVEAIGQLLERYPTIGQPAAREEP